MKKLPPQNVQDEIERTVLFTKDTLYKEIKVRLNHLPGEWAYLYMRSSVASTALTIIQHHYTGMKKNPEATHKDREEFKLEILKALDTIFKGE